MKTAAFIAGFLLVFAGVEPASDTPLWMCLPVLGSGLALMFWSIAPETSKNRYKK